MAAATTEELNRLRSETQEEVRGNRVYADELHAKMQLAHSAVESNLDAASEGFTEEQKRLNTQLNEMRSAMEVLDRKFAAFGAGKSMRWNRPWCT